MTGIGASDHHKRTEAKVTAGSAASESVTWTTAFSATPIVAAGPTSSTYPVGVTARSTTGATIANDAGGGGQVKMCIAQEAT